MPDRSVCASCRALADELRHQVVARSRELAQALARAPSPEGAREPAVGELFDGRYRVVRKLGEGGMGAVLEVERQTDSTRYALKVITGAISSASAARFAREAEIGASIRHPNIVSIVDVGVARGGVPFLVMELVQGGSLESHRARFGDSAWALPLLCEIAEGVKTLHAEGVVHRDLKPGNVIVDATTGVAVAKVADFGISRFGELVDSGQSVATAPTLAAGRGVVTATGVLVGTPMYMPPEAAHGGTDVQTSADVFAFGVVAYEMLCGALPYWPRDRYLELAPKYWRDTRARLDDAELVRPIGHVTVPTADAAEEQPATR